MLETFGEFFLWLLLSVYQGAGLDAEDVDGEELNKFNEESLVTEASLNTHLVNIDTAQEVAEVVSGLMHGRSRLSPEIFSPENDGPLDVCFNSGHVLIEPFENPLDLDIWKLDFFDCSAEKNVNGSAKLVVTTRSEYGDVYGAKLIFDSLTVDGNEGRTVLQGTIRFKVLEKEYFDGTFGGYIHHSYEVEGYLPVSDRRFKLEAFEEALGRTEIYRDTKSEYFTDIRYEGVSRDSVSGFVTFQYDSSEGVSLNEGTEDEGFVVGANTVLGKDNTSAIFSAEYGQFGLVPEEITGSIDADGDGLYESALMP